MPHTRSLLAILLILAALLGLAQPGAAQEVEIRSEGFEGTFPGTQWFVLDYDFDSGSDYWGASSILAHTGTRSAWCAQVGTHSVLGGPNSNSGTYDNDMLASMELRTGDLSGYQSVTLSFWYQLFTEPTLDYFAVGTGTSEADFPADSVERFRDSGTVSAWTRREISIPTDTRLILFMFVSDLSVYSGGALVDDVSLVGQLPPPLSDGTITLVIVAGVVAAAGGTVGVLLWRRRASVPKVGEPPQQPAPPREPPVGPSAPEEAPPPEPGEPETPETRICPNCGTTNPGDLVHCLDCGAKLT